MPPTFVPLQSPRPADYPLLYRPTVAAEAAPIRRCEHASCRALQTAPNSVDSSPVNAGRPAQRLWGRALEGPREVREHVRRTSRGEWHPPGAAAAAPIRSAPPLSGRRCARRGCTRDRTCRAQGPTGGRELRSATGGSTALSVRAESGERQPPAPHHTRAAHWMTQQTMVPMSVLNLSAMTSVRIIIVRYVTDAPRRTLSVIFWNCFFGPWRNIVLREAKES